MVTTTEQGDHVRMVIDPIGDWEHSAYQSDSQFVVEVRQKKVDLNKLSQGPGYSNEKLSLNFQSIELRSLLAVFADFTNINIVTSDTVTGAMTLRLQDVPWDQALQIIMEAKGLGMRKTGNVLWIAPKDEIDDRTKKDFEAAQAIQKLEPLRTQAFQMNYAKAADMVTQLTTTSGGTAGSTSNRFLSERGSAIAEPRTNQLFVTDTAQKLEEVRQLLAKLDVAVRQVMIEARIVEASDTFGRSLGVRLGGTDLRANRGGDGGYNLGGGNRVAVGTSYSNAVASTSAGGLVNTLGNFVNLPAQAQGGYDPSSFAISIFNSAANRFLNLEISAMEADGKGKIVSSPRVVTADQTKASIEQGTEFPYPVTAPNGGTIIAFKKAVLKLEVLPQITPEGNIILDLDVNKDSPGEVLNNVRAINTKRIQTQVLVENGGTVVIGGIFELFEDDTEAKVPFLGDIPGVGNLFKTRTKQANKQEMLIFITPKVITDRSAFGAINDLNLIGWKMQKLLKFLGLVVASTLTACGGGGGSPGDSSLPYSISVKAEKNQLPINIAEERPGINGYSGIGAYSPYTTTLYVEAREGDAPIPGWRKKFLAVIWLAVSKSGALYYLDGKDEHMVEVDDGKGGKLKVPAHIAALCWIPTAGGNSFHFHAGDMRPAQRANCCVRSPTPQTSWSLVQV
jgi:type IV pilus assembly protein PilQ